MSIRALPGAALAALLALNLAAAALAGPPAAIPDSGRERAGRAFESFASEWMAKMEKAERQNRSRPKVHSDRFTFRGYGSEFETELKPTGHPAAPYVGVLRYREELWSCSDRAAEDCSVSNRTPVTEIFRFQNGRWIY